MYLPNNEIMSHNSRPPSIVYGPATPVPLRMTFTELLDHNAVVHGDRPTVISDPQSKTLSFQELRDRSIQLARAMSRDGVGKGDLVAISLGSRTEDLETGGVGGLGDGTVLREVDAHGR